MRLSAPKLFLALAIFLPFLRASSIACSFADGYLGTTTYDLVKDADAILLAEPVSEEGNIVLFNVTEVMKGEYDSKVIRTRSFGNNCFPYNFLTKISYPREILLQFTPPEIKFKYILFVDKTRAGWIVSEEAASRTAIPITKSDESLLKKIRHFIRIDSIRDYEVEKKELKKLAKLAKSGRNITEYPRSLVADLEKYFKFPSPHKSFKDLKQLNSHSSKEEKRDVLWALAWGKHAEAADFIIDLLKNPIPLNYLGPFSEFIARTKNETLLLRLGKNYPTLDKESRWPLMWALIRTADERHKDMMLAALRSADKEEAGRLVEWFVRYPNDDATEIVKALVGKDYQENYEISLGLAGLGDGETLSWAKEFMNSSSEDRWMAYYAIARSPLKEADNLAKRVIEASGTDDLVSLIQGYKESRNPNRWDRLRDINGRAKRDAKVDYWLRVTLNEMSDDGDNYSPIVITTLQK